MPQRRICPNRVHILFSHEIYKMFFLIITIVSYTRFPFVSYLTKCKYLHLVVTLRSILFYLLINFSWLNTLIIVMQIHLLMKYKQWINYYVWVNIDEYTLSNVLVFGTLEVVGEENFQLWKPVIRTCPAQFVMLRSLSASFFNMIYTFVIIWRTSHQ